MLEWLAVGLAGVAQGVTGFGFGIVAMAGLTPIIGPQEANLIVTPLATVTIAVALWHVRRDIAWRRALPLWIGGFLGTPVGVYILEHTDPLWLNRLIGVAIIVAAFTSLRGVQPAEKPMSSWWALAAGTLGGVMAGAVAMGGPPAVVFAYRQPWPLGGIKSTLLLFFALTVAYRLVLFARHGLYTPALLSQVGLWLPLVALTTWAGSRLSERAPRKQVDQVVAGLLTLAGICLLLK